MTEPLLRIARGCPGLRFAVLEMKVILVKLVQRFDFDKRDQHTHIVSRICMTKV